MPRTSKKTSKQPEPKRRRSRAGTAPPPMRAMLDDLVAMALQLEPADLVELTKLRSMLQKIVSDPPTPEAQVPLMSAMGEIDALVQGQALNASESLARAVRLLEQAGHPVEGGPSGRGDACDLSPDAGAAEPVEPRTEPYLPDVSNGEPVLEMCSALDPVQPETAAMLPAQDEEPIGELLPADADKDLLGEFIAGGVGSPAVCGSIQQEGVQG